MGDRHYSLVIHIFKIVIIFFMPSSIIILNISAAEALGISKYERADINTSPNGTMSLNVTHLCKDIDNQSCKRKACPIDPSQPGCIINSEPKPNISEIYKLEQQTRH
jgi:hypothetical protein